MPKSFEDLKTLSSRVKDFVDEVQIDIMDGDFVENKSWPYTEGKNDDESLPFSESLDYEADLMIKNPEEKLEDIFSFRFKKIVFHIESSEDIKEAIQKAREYRGDIKVGIAINIDTPNERLYELLESVEYVQFMGIKTIGLQGEGFDKRVLKKIKKFIERNPEIPISVDGGINEENAKQCAKAGATHLAVGSYILNSEDPKKAIKNIILKSNK